MARPRDALPLGSTGFAVVSCVWECYSAGYSAEHEQSPGMAGKGMSVGCSWWGVARTCPKETRGGRCGGGGGR